MDDKELLEEIKRLEFLVSDCGAITLAYDLLDLTDN